MSQTRPLSAVQASVLFAAQQQAVSLTAQAQLAQGALSQAMALVADNLGVPVTALGEVDLTNCEITLKGINPPPPTVPPKNP